MTKKNWGLGKVFEEWKRQILERVVGNVSYPPDCSKMIQYQSFYNYKEGTEN